VHMGKAGITIRNSGRECSLPTFLDPHPFFHYGIDFAAGYCESIFLNHNQRGFCRPAWVLQKRDVYSHAAGLVRRQSDESNSIVRV